MSHASHLQQSKGHCPQVSLHNGTTMMSTQVLTQNTWDPGRIRAGMGWHPRQGKGGVEVGLWGELMTAACEGMRHPNLLNLFEIQISVRLSQ